MASNKPSSDGRSRRPRQLTTKGHDFAISLLWKEFNRRNRKLSNQRSLFDDLMKTGDVKLTNCELIKLDPMLVDLEEASGKLLEVTKRDERKQVVDKLQVERSSVSKLKIAIKEWLDAQDRDDQSVRSLKSNNSQGKSAICLTIELIGVQSRLESYYV